MKKLFIAIILASLFVTVINNAVADTYRVEHAETTAQDDAVQKLVQKLEERDSTIETLQMVGQLQSDKIEQLYYEKFKLKLENEQLKKAKVKPSKEEGLLKDAIRKIKAIVSVF